MFKVLKSFNTRNRRISEGETVSETDDLAPHTIEGLAAGKFIEAPKSEKRK
ncbi:hypothetical protein [Aminobacter aminovorans]|uniref:Uncharacterized protein n=1 Tax=Aminobacter aminovorans TaxID=83263 RepID=A0AAC9AR54_AMIAI|nr:hypothetical protein [Aminobacter aminovorans]AMS41159.1 hypothetical protein AA2016_2230 [Aminobacter aminovorans]MBB3705859.1 hypothetical protein [Aminobacter aminovorans]